MREIECFLPTVLVRLPPSSSISQTLLRSELHRLMNEDLALVSAGPPTMDDLLSEIGMAAGKVTQIHEDEDDETRVTIQLLDTPRGRMVWDVMLAVNPKGLAPLIVDTTWKGAYLVRMHITPNDPWEEWKRWPSRQ